LWKFFVSLSTNRPGAFAERVLDTQTRLFEANDVLERLGISALNPGAYCSSSGWAEADPLGAFDALNPATEEVPARVCTATVADHDRIIGCAADACRRWRMMPTPRRGELVARIGELAAQNHEALGAVVSLETGCSVLRENLP
jgi:aldehyde dehydrogenase (NAD+)